MPTADPVHTLWRVGMAWYVGLYMVGVVAGLAANIALDVQLRRPGFRQAIGLVIFALLIWGAVSITHAPLAELLLPILWAGTGVLAGLGSRTPTAPG